MSLSEVEHLLTTRIGFDFHSVGHEAISNVVKLCMAESGFTDPDLYARKLIGDADLWNRLVDRVVIGETWFFRDHAPFELAAEFARTSLLRALRTKFRILSCPCSSGEEPYSLVMAMLHGGIPAESLLVDAADVSGRALTVAAAGVYRERSWRAAAPRHRAEFFEPLKDGSWRLRDSVKSLVRFVPGNLLEPEFVETAERYDLVFCRNLLIYLTPEARRLALAALERLLAPQGMLVLGHAEGAIAWEYGFAPAGPAGAFAFRKPGRRNPGRTSRDRNRTAALGSLPRPLGPAGAGWAAAPVVPEEKKPPQASPPSLDVIRKLGDTGRLEEALAAGGEYLRENPACAEAYFLYGVLQNAAGRIDLATSVFRKALYLDPNHREALLHMALRREAGGDHPGAALLRARASAQPESAQAGDS